MTTLPPGNRLLESLPSEDRAAVVAHSVTVDFAQGQVFYEPGDRIEHAYFVENGVVSSVAVLADGRTVETLMIGREGLVGASACIGPMVSHTRVNALIAGSARRLDTARLRTLCSERLAIREAIAAFQAELQRELEQSAACNALHRADQRFAKWLLRSNDRVGGDALAMTQEYLASMLGAQRTTLNEAAQTMQKAGAIAYSRGRIRVTDRAALERVACECYRVSARERGVH